jgi:hypothetical protein
MAERILKCIGNTCTFVKDNLPELVGTSAAVAMDVASLDFKNALLKGAGTIANVKDQLAKLQKEITITKVIIERITKTIKSLKRRKYTVCSLEELDNAVKYAKSLVDSFDIENSIKEGVESYKVTNGSSQKDLDSAVAITKNGVNRAMKTVYYEWYRDEISRIMMLITTLLNSLNLEVNALLINIHITQAEPDKQKRKRMLNDLKKTCTNIQQ